MEETTCNDRPDLVQSSRTEVRQEKTVEPVVRTLLGKLEALERQRRAIDRDIESIHRALDLAGVRPTGLVALKMATKQWLRNIPHMKLNEACLAILRAAEGEWLSKTQVEFTLVKRGYKFAAKDSKNSVDVTLRRLAKDERCEARREKGSKGNLYRVPKEEGQERAVTETAAD